MITVKAELAQRLLDVDPERARAEVADLERLSRDALSDVRRAVEGYRELTLPGELARARTALAAAEIDADLPNSTDEVPSEQRELFAWTVREGVTNVIRHSGAQRCTVRLTSDAGRGRSTTGAARGVRRAGGSGLLGPPRAGLRARRHGDHPVPVEPRATRCGCVGPDDHPAAARRRPGAGPRCARGAARPRARPEVVAEVGPATRSSPAVLEHRPDVALLDVEMPGLDGISATAEVRAAAPETRVLIVTTFGRPGLPAAGAAGRRQRVRGQGHPGRQLADAVRRIHQGLRVVDPALATDSLLAGESPAHRARDRGAPGRPRRLVGRHDRRRSCSSPRAPCATTSPPRSARPAPRNRAEAVLIADGNGWL